MQEWMHTWMTSHIRTFKYQKPWLRTVLEMHALHNGTGYRTHCTRCIHCMRTCSHTHRHRHAYEHATHTYTTYIRTTHTCKHRCHHVPYEHDIFLLKRQSCTVTAWGRCFHRAVRWFAGLRRIPLSSVWSNDQPGDTVWRAMLREWPLRILQWGDRA